MNYKVISPKLLIKKNESKKEGIISVTEDEFIRATVVSVDPFSGKDKRFINKDVVVHRRYAVPLPDDNSYYIITSEDILVYH